MLAEEGKEGPGGVDDRHLLGVKGERGVSDGVSARDPSIMVTDRLGTNLREAPDKDADRVYQGLSLPCRADHDIHPDDGPVSRLFIGSGLVSIRPKIPIRRQAGELEAVRQHNCVPPRIGRFFYTPRAEAKNADPRADSIRRVPEKASARSMPAREPPERIGRIQDHVEVTTVVEKLARLSPRGGVTTGSPASFRRAVWPGRGGLTGPTQAVRLRSIIGGRPAMRN